MESNDFTVESNDLIRSKLERIKSNLWVFEFDDERTDDMISSEKEPTTI